MKSRYTMFAGYNRWANERLYEAASQLSDADYRADRGAFFKSMHGTLNHMVVADRIWMHRFTGTGDAPTQLDAILYEDFAPLRHARRAEDERRPLGPDDDLSQSFARLAAEVEDRLPMFCRPAARAAAKEAAV